jgi:hypothetical protein
MMSHPGEWTHRLRSATIKLVAVTALGALLTMTVMGLEELRAALAFARFDMARRTVDKLEGKPGMTDVLERASREAGMIMRCGSHDPQVLWEISRACGRWSRATELQNPLLRLELAEKSAQAAALATCAAPTDYTNWLQLARAQAALGLKAGAQKCSARAQMLAPAHKSGIAAKRQATR